MSTQIDWMRAVVRALSERNAEPSVPKHQPERILSLCSGELYPAGERAGNKVPALMVRRAEDFDPRCQWAANATGPAVAITAGDVITFAAAIRDEKKQMPQFPLANPTALYLHFAEQMYQKCKKTTDIERNSQGHAVNESAVFDFIEKRMAVVIFAFSALEAFANEYIPPDYQHETLRESGLYVLKSKKDIQRWYSLETKLFELLPGILKAEAPKRGTKIHNCYLALQRLRDRIIHCTAEDRVRSGPDDKSLWNALLGKTFRDFAADAADIIAFFVASGPRKEPRWLSMRHKPARTDK